MIYIAASFSLAAPAFFSRTGPIAAHQWHRHHQSRGCGRALADLCGKPPESSSGWANPHCTSVNDH